MEINLRRWRMEDAPALAGMMNNKRIQDNLRDGLPYPYTKQDATDFIEAMLTADPNSTFAFAVTVEDTAIGSVGIFRQSNIHFRTAELGYYIAEPYWGQGVGTRAVGQACDFIFRQTDILRIFAEPFAYNLASCRVLQKSGFQHEGTLRKNAVKNGAVLDMELYSRIREEKTENTR